MHSDVCAFVSDAFYDGRLTSHHDCAQQQLSGVAAPLHATGTHFIAVDHEGNRTASPEEAGAVQAVVDQLHGGEWTDAHGSVRPLTPADILVVAPYNAQVKRLRRALQGGATVGTVDRFQGAEGAVTIYSMATSSAEDVPRGIEFLFSRNRLNVAVSRARCVAVLVCAPELLQVRCRTPEQLRLVNALCLYVEMAHAVDPRGAVAVHGV
jgi:uncharacterized protein